MSLKAISILQNGNLIATEMLIIKKFQLNLKSAFPGVDASSRYYKETDKKHKKQTTANR